MRLSKVARRIRNCLDLDFHEGTVTMCGDMVIFVTVLTHEFEILDSERNLSTLIKVNLQSASK